MYSLHAHRELECSLFSLCCSGLPVSDFAFIRLDPAHILRSVDTSIAIQVHCRLDTSFAQGDSLSLLNLKIGVRLSRSTLCLDRQFGQKI